jgi:archaetidylinositol phosphate synthase
MKISFSNYYVLYKKYERPPSTFFHRIISKNIAKILAYIFLRLNIKPNFITILSFLLFLTSFIFLYYSYNLFFFLIFTQLSYAFDCSDGVVARITNATSRFGGYLDLLIDRTSTILFFILLYFIYFKKNIDIIVSNSDIDFLYFLFSSIILLYSISGILISLFFKEKQSTISGNNIKFTGFKYIVTKIIKFLYEFIDTGTMYFIVSLSLYFNVYFYILIFYASISYIILSAQIFYLYNYSHD